MDNRMKKPVNDVFPQAIPPEESPLLNDITHIIKKICSEHGITVTKMLLFGSRARGDYKSTSDYDFIVITPTSLSHEKKMELWLYTSRALAEIHVDADILFKSQAEFESDRNNKGKVTYYAVKDGISI
jgi:uncharacterized protein